MLTINRPGMRMKWEKRYFFELKAKIPLTKFNSKREANLKL